MKLSLESQHRARTFVMEQGRPLEQALSRFFFDGEPAQAALDELAFYQNADGGFGHGLEPDLQLPASSVLATTVALQHLRALGAGEDNSLALGAMRYLMATFDPAIEAWPIIPNTVDEAPHAPWWAFDDQLAERWRGFKANPRAEIVGYLFDYPALSPVDLREELAEVQAMHLETSAGALETHDLLCYVRLVETHGLPGPLRSWLLPRLAPVVDRLVATQPEAWAQYGLKPLAVAGSPDSPFAGQLAAAIERNLDYEISQQGPDGAWAPAWSWFGLYEDAWPQAERDWKSVLTVKTLRQLQQFDRLEQRI